MARLSQSLLCCVALVLFAGSAAAAGAGLDVELHISKRIGVRGSVATVVVGDPKIADVSVIDASSVLVTGRGYGRTNLLVLDGAGRTLLESYVNVVGTRDAQVTVYRGASGTDYDCTAHCVQPASESGGILGGGSGSGSGGAPAVKPSVTIESKMTISNGGS